MNKMSYNIRGSGNSGKRRNIQQTIRLGMVDVCFIKETKFQKLDYKLVFSKWGDSEVEWSSCDSKGLSGVF